MAGMGWSHEADVVVAGSGAAGLAAAVGAAAGGCSVELLEKAAQIGGTTAFSGGMPWVPCNDHMTAAGVPDDPAEALRYIDSLLADREPDHTLVETFVREAGRAVATLEDLTPLKFTLATHYSDYYADHPGGRNSGRSLEVVPFAERAELGEQARLVRGTPHLPNLTQSEMVEAGTLRGLTVNDEGNVLSKLKYKMAERAEQGVSTKGVALAGALFKGALDHGVRVRTSAPVVELVLDDDGGVLGVVADVAGERVAVRADRGVVVATGGFEWSAELLQAFVGTRKLLPLSPPTNVGDGLVMGLAAGARVANMTAVLGQAALYDEVAVFEHAPLGMFATPRGHAGVIIVNRAGRRFVNEGIAYADIGKVQRVYDPLTQTFPNDPPNWLVFDKAVRDRTIVGSLVPGEPTPAWVLEAPSLRELAGLMGVDPGVFHEEIERFNRFVENGRDPEFGRGTAWYEGFSTGGPDPAKNLGSCAVSPFYAMKLYDGVLGTAGGMLTNGVGQVLRMRGGMVQGLYAAGNAAAGIFGQAYPGGGSAIGPALTFGYLAGESLAARDSKRPEALGGVTAG